MMHMWKELEGKEIALDVSPLSQVYHRSRRKVISP